MGDSRPPLTALPESARTQALTRFTQLRPHLEDGVALARVARGLGISPRTAGRWVARYRREGLAGLVRRPRRDGDQHRLHPELRQLIEGLALRPPRQSLAAIQREVARLATEHGWPAPSYKVTRAIVRELAPALTTLAHEGTKAYRLRFDLLCRWEADRPNDLWQADHTPLDVWVRDEQERAVKPWLTVILDDYSRAVAGFRLSLAVPTVLHTALTLRDAIWRKADSRWHVCGIPTVFYSDHGGDFTSRHLEQVAADLGMLLINSEAGMPRGRGKIERFFRTVSQGCLCQLPGYAPPGAAPVKPVLTLAELELRLNAFLLDDYHRRPHGETGAPPQERWTAGGFLPCLPERLEQLDLLLLTVATARQVRPDGIRFQGLRYLDLTLAAYVGETVTIRYDPHDLAELRVYHRDRFLCRAVCQELAGQRLSLKEIEQARGDRRRLVRAELTDRRAVLDAFVAVHQPEERRPAPAPPPAEPMVARLKRYRDD